MGVRVGYVCTSHVALYRETCSQIDPGQSYRHQPATTDPLCFRISEPSSCHEGKNRCRYPLHCTTADSYLLRSRVKPANDGKIKSANYERGRRSNRTRTSPASNALIFGGAVRGPVFVPLTAFKGYYAVRGPACAPLTAPGSGYGISSRRIHPQKGPLVRTERHFSAVHPQ